VTASALIVLSHMGSCMGGGTRHCQCYTPPDLGGKIRWSHARARHLPVSSRAAREGNRSRNFWSSLRAHAYSVDRRVNPIRRNKTPWRMGRIRPATPSATKLHPEMMTSQRLNLLRTAILGAPETFAPGSAGGRSGYRFIFPDSHQRAQADCFAAPAKQL